jgi:hypothetical protein
MVELFMEIRKEVTVLYTALLGFVSGHDFSRATLDERWQD